MRNKSMTTALSLLVAAVSLNASAATSTLLGPLTFTGANGAPLPAGVSTAEGSWSIYSNTAKAGTSSSRASFKMNPARANESTSTSFTIVDRALGTVKGVICSARNGTGVTSSGYLIGADDTGHGSIWTVNNDVATLRAKGGVQYGSLNGTLTAKCDLTGTHPVLTLTTSVDKSVLTWTDTNDTYKKGGTDIRVFTNHSGVAFDNITISGTPLSTTTSTSTSTTSTSPTSTSTSTTPTSTTSTSPTSTTTTTSTSVVHSANLVWSIPTTRTDGTPLAVTDLSGYEVYYTNSTGTTNVSVPVSGGTTTSTTVANLASGTYYFSMSSIDTSGLKSPLSTLVTTVIP